MNACFDNIPRRAGIGRDELWNDHLRRQLPVVLEGLFEGQPIAELSSLPWALTRLGSLPLTVRPEYTGGLLRALERGPAPGGGAERTSFASYWARVEREPDTTVMSTEEPLAPELSELISPPPLCSLPDGAADDDLVSACFVGNAGNHAPIHFDGDGRHVALYQLFGRKRVVVIPVRRARALRPLVNFSTLRLHDCDESTKSRLLEALDAWDTILEPGQTIVMPAFVYHYVEYLDHGMSVNFRFGRRPLHRFLSEHLHLDLEMQALASRALGAQLDPPVREAMGRVLETLSQPAPSSWLGYQRTRRAIRDELEALDDPVLREPELDPALGAPYVELPPVARACVLRMHLFNERLYRHRLPLATEAALGS